MGTLPWLVAPHCNMDILHLRRTVAQCCLACACRRFRHRFAALRAAFNGRVAKVPDAATILAMRQSAPHTSRLPLPRRNPAC
jgi:hypothetical protein